MIKTFDLTVDIEQPINNKSFKVNTNDLNSLQLNISIVKNKLPINLTGKTVRIAIVKPDRKTVFQDCTITDAENGQSEVVLGTQAYVVSGIHVAEIMVFEGTEKVSVTGRFQYVAVKGILDDSTIESTNDFQAITQAIAEAEAILTDLRENGTAVDAEARNGLNSVRAELAEKANEDYVDTKVAQVADGAPRGTYATLVDLETAYPSGDSGNYVLQSDGHIYNWDGTAWVNTGIFYQAAGIAREGITRDKLAEDSVPFNVLSFVKKSNNLFNKNIVTPGYSISGTTGELVANSGYNVSEFEYVKGNQLYSLANVGRWALYDENLTFISSNTNSSFTTPSNAFYARFAVSTGSLLTAQVNSGSLVAYDEYEAKVEEGLNGLVIKTSFNTVQKDAMTRNSVDPFSMINFKEPKNLFNKNDLVENVNFSFSNYGAEIEDTTRDASKYIRVKPQQIYNKGAYSIYINYYDKNKKWGLLEQIGTSTLTFTTPVWCYFVRVSIAKTSVSAFMLSEGEAELPYEEHVFELQSTPDYPLKINNGLLSGVSVEENLIMPYRTYNYTKQPYADLVNSLSSTGCVVENLGLSSDGVHELYGLSYGDTTTKPVIFSIGNQHGSEWESVYYGLDFMKTVSGVKPFQDPSLLASLTDTFSFYFIVSANPWGYENSSYVNFNGVNLNRNWDNNWEGFPSGDGTNQYKGTAPFSEVDLQIVRDKFLELDPYMMIDLHTSGQTPGGFDTGKIYTEYRNLLLDCYNKMYEVYDDAGLPVQEWNIGGNPTSVGWSGLQVSKEGTNCISTVLEQPTYWDGNYGLTALFMLSIYARDHYLGS